MNEEEKEAYYFFKEQRAMYNKWVADKTASESDVVLARYYNLLFEILGKQQEELKQEKEKNKKLEEVIDIMAEDILLLGNITEELAGIGVRVPITGGKEAIKEYYLNKVKEKQDDK